MESIEGELGLRRGPSGLEMVQHCVSDSCTHPLTSSLKHTASFCTPSLLSLPTVRATARGPLQSSMPGRGLELPSRVPIKSIFS